MKKVLFILLILTIFAAMFIGAWWFLMRGGEEPTTDVGEQTQRTFNPFGMFSDIGTDTTPNDTGDTNSAFPDVPFPSERHALIQISDKPVAGVTALSVQIGTSTDYLVRYVERETGHMYDTSVVTLGKTRISNTTIPQVREALFGNSGNSVALRRITDDGETTETFFGTIADASTSTQSEARFSGMFLPENILSITLHPTQHRAFYTLKTETGGAGYIVSKTGTQNVFLHPFYQWQASWNASSTITLSTAPSYGVGGLVFSLNPSSGALERISSTTPSITALPNIYNTNILYGTAGRAGVSVFVYNRQTRQTTPLSVTTLPEKCAWGSATIVYCAVPANATRDVPDTWYRGELSFIDTLWKIDTATGIVTFLFDPSTIDENGMDMTHLSPSQDGTHLAFINKKDGSLWLADLSLMSASEESELSY